MVLRSKEESDEVVALYGAQAALDHPNLLRDGILKFVKQALFLTLASIPFLALFPIH